LVRSSERAPKYSRRFLQAALPQHKQVQPQFLGELPACGGNAATFDAEFARVGIRHVEHHEQADLLPLCPQLLGDLVSDDAVEAPPA